MIYPILVYGSEIWNVKNFRNVEKVQYIAMRYFLCVHKFAPLHGIYGEMGWTPN